MSAQNIQLRQIRQRNNSSKIRYQNIFDETLAIPISIQRPAAVKTVDTALAGGKMIAIFLSKDAAIDNSPSADIYALRIAATVPDSGIRQAWKSLIPLLVNKATLIDLVRGRLFRELDKNIITYFGILLF